MGTSQVKEVKGKDSTVSYRYSSHWFRRDCFSEDRMLLSVIEIERKASMEDGLAIDTPDGYDAALGWIHVPRTGVGLLVELRSTT